MNNNLTSNNKICPNCGGQNNPNTNFCTNCGANLSQGFNPNPNQNLNNTPNDNNTNVNNDSNNNNANQVNTESTPTESLNFFQYIINSLIKPFDIFKKEENNLTDIKNTSILSLIVVALFTVINLITTIINSVRVKSYWDDETKWVWDNIKEIKFLKVIGQSFLMYAGIIIAIAGIYYLASLVIKKNTSFIKMIGASVTAFIPFATLSLVVSPLLGLIYDPLSIYITIIGLVYGIVIIIELMNDIIQMEKGSIRIYLNLICLSIVFIVGIIVIQKVILSSLTSSLSGLLG